MSDILLDKAERIGHLLYRFGGLRVRFVYEEQHCTRIFGAVVLLIASIASLSLTHAAVLGP